LDLEEYKSILVMILVVNKINKETNLLPNITLGYHIFNTCSDPKNTLGYVIKILSGEKQAPNYYCDVLVVEEHCIFHFSYFHCLNNNISQHIIQISYQVTNPHLSDGKAYPTLFRVTPADRVRFAALITFLQHFGWNWIGIITSWDGSGDEEAQELSNMMSQHGICTEYIIQLSSNILSDAQTLRIISKSTSKVIVVCGNSMMYFNFLNYPLSPGIKGITFIFPPSWIRTNNVNYVNENFVNCSFIFLWPRENNPNMDVYTKAINFSSCLNDPIMEDLWIFTFNCLSPNPEKNLYFKLFDITLNPCTVTKDLSSLYTYITPASYVYRAVYVLAHALHEMYMKKNKSEQHGFQHRLNKYVRNLYYTDPDDGEIYFNERKEVPTDLILKSCSFINSTHSSYRTISTIQSPDYAPEPFIDMSDPSFWKTGKVLVSRCSDPCLPGSRKKFGSSMHKCCYECVPCSEGEISNISDSENCMKCPDDEWPNEKKDLCVPKLMEFLSYTDDPIVTVISTVSILCCLLTGLILGIFIHYQDTPIVKANNRNLSYLLLVSIMLSFLCVFLFLGHPVDVTCMLRVTSFGVIFSVAVSSLLSKSIMVCIAFKATKPGSPWRKWMGAKLPNSIICIFSLVQVIICASWLSISPPFQDRDTHSYQGKIIIQCNEGSVIGFYSVLGYMGLLAAVSFIIAFIARTLPDSFNEAKYITFSMLVFCSVWIAMIPAYLSTRGKYMVGVEVFAIMASSSGLLGCIFFPKCYRILFRPDLNTKAAFH
ncbi:vomeronasal type-2 receptor 116-like, partial [Lithobates pipiens]